MEKIKVSDFKQLSAVEDSQPCLSCNKLKFQGWGSLPKELDDELGVVGEFIDSEKNVEEKGYSEYHPNGTNYWSKEAPIAINYYPYHESIIKRCSMCGAIFLCYTEFGGHAPQRRVRWVRENLVCLPL